MRGKSQKMIEYEAWMKAWLAEHPLPPMSKKARWRIAQDAWDEMRRRERATERAEQPESAP